MSIIKPFTFVAGTKARADEVNRDFDVLYSQVNSNISSINDLNTDVENLDQDKADKEGSTSQTFKVANPVNNYDAVNKQTMGNKITPLYGYIDGLIITKDNNDSKTIIVSAGSCYDTTKEVALSLSLPLSKQNATQSANSTYYVYIIGDNSGSNTDILISVDAVTPTLPTGYTKFRQIGYYVTDGNNIIRTIYNNGIGSLNTVWNNAFPSNRYIDLTWVAGGSFVAPADGWFCVNANYKEGGVGLYINGLGMGNSISNNSGARTYGNVSVEVSRGQTVITQLYPGDGVTVTLFRFVYAKGDE